MLCLVKLPKPGLRPTWVPDFENSQRLPNYKIYRVGSNSLILIKNQVSKRLTVHAVFVDQVSVRGLPHSDLTDPLVEDAQTTRTTLLDWMSLANYNAMTKPKALQSSATAFGGCSK